MLDSFYGFYLILHPSIYLILLLFIVVYQFILLILPTYIIIASINNDNFTSTFTLFIHTASLSLMVSVYMLEKSLK